MKITKQYLKQIIKEEVKQIFNENKTMVDPIEVNNYIHDNIRTILDGSIETKKRSKLVYQKLEGLKNALFSSVIFFSKDGTGVDPNMVKAEIKKVQDVMLYDEDPDLQETRNSLSQLQNMLET